MWLARLPDVRDGLKPVHRRILVRYEQKRPCESTARHRKSAHIVGEVMGKYHPHGDTAIYDAMVRMAQPWSMRYMLVDGQGNFGSMDGDPPAAYALYRGQEWPDLADALLADIDKETVPFRDNYDGTAPRTRSFAGQAAKPTAEWPDWYCRWYGHQHPTAQPQRDC